MTTDEALAVTDMGENALWRWVKAAGPQTQWLYDSPDHARQVALDVLAARVRELEASENVIRSTLGLRTVETTGAVMRAICDLKDDSVELAALKARACETCRFRHNILSSPSPTISQQIDVCGQGEHTGAFRGDCRV